MVLLLQNVLSQKNMPLIFHYTSFNSKVMIDKKALKVPLLRQYSDQIL